MLLAGWLFGFVTRESHDSSCSCLPRSCESCIVPRARHPWQHTWARQVVRGPSHAHVNPLMRAWAVPPTCMSRGLRAYQGVYAHTQGLTCERAMWLSGRYHPGQAPDNVREQPIPPGTAQNADHFTTSSPLSAFFTEVVCDVGATPPQTASSPSPIGGNCTTRGSDTPATRRQRASCSAKPPSQPPEVRRIAYKAWHSTGWREKLRPTPALQ